MPTRIAILTNIPAPYRLGFFQKLAEKCDLRVIFDAPTEPNRAWTIPKDMGFPYVYAGGFTISYLRRRPDGFPADRRYLQLRYGILAELAKARPEVVISAEMGLRTMQALLYCSLRRVPLIVWSEGTPHTEGWVSGRKRAIRRYLVSRSSRFWVNGVESARLIGSYGASERSIDQGLIGIDTRRFSSETRRLLAERERVRFDLAVRGTVFLFVGQLVPRKGIREFLAALDRLAPARGPYSVLLAGDGDEKALIEKWAGDHPQVPLRLLGFLQADALPPIFAAADVFVLPTLDDNWSLVALEAAVAGLPQVFSRYNAAGADLTAHGASGVSIDPYDTAAFTDALESFRERTPDRAAPEVTASLVDYYSPEHCAGRAWDSIQKAAGTNRAS